MPSLRIPVKTGSDPCGSFGARHLRGRNARRDHPLEQVLYDRVRLRDHADAVPVLVHEPGDHVRCR
jgi:hypothetical protein